MRLRVEELREKEVVNVNDGTKLGFVGDLEFETQTAAAKALIIYGRLRLLGLLGREEDTVIPWESVRLIGDDTVLVDHRPESRQKSAAGRKKSFLSRWIEFR